MAAFTNAQAATLQLHWAFVQITTYCMYHLVDLLYITVCLVKMIRQMLERGFWTSKVTLDILLWMNKTLTKIQVFKWRYLSVGRNVELQYNLARPEKTLSPVKKKIFFFLAENSGGGLSRLWVCRAQSQRSRWEWSRVSEITPRGFNTKTGRRQAQEINEAGSGGKPAAGRTKQFGRGERQKKWFMTVLMWNKEQVRGNRWQCPDRPRSWYHQEE